MKNILKSIVYILTFILIQLLVQIGFVAFTVSNVASTQSDVMEYIKNNTLLIGFISNIASILIIAFFRKIRQKVPTKIFCFQNVTLKNCLISAVTAFSFSICFSLLTYYIQFENDKQIAQSSVYFSSIVSYLGPVMEILTLLIASPIVEEYICRGVLFEELGKKFSVGNTIILSAVIFGVLHIIAGGIVLALGATLMGLIFGFIYLKTKSLAVAVISHSCANLSGFIFQLIPNVNIFTIIIGSIVCTGITRAGLFLLNKANRLLVVK